MHKLHASVTAVLFATLPLSAQAWLPPQPFPAWGAAVPAGTMTLAYDPQQSTTANGARLQAALSALTPGRALAIGPGTWSITGRLDLFGTGSPQAPYFVIAANPAQRPVITRPDVNQNAVNVGSGGPARY